MNNDYGGRPPITAANSGYNTQNQGGFQSYHSHYSQPQRGPGYGPISELDRVLYGQNSGSRISTAPDRKSTDSIIGAQGIYADPNDPASAVSPDRLAFDYAKKIASSVQTLVANMSRGVGEAVLCAFERFKHPGRIRGIDPVCEIFIKDLTINRHQWLHNVYPNVMRGLTYLLFYELRSTDKEPSLEWLHNTLEQITLTCCAVEFGDWLIEQPDSYRLLEDLTEAGRDMLENRKINFVPDMIKMRQELATLNGVIDEGPYPWKVDCVKEILKQYEYSSEVARPQNMASAGHSGSVTVISKHGSEVYYGNNSYYDSDVRFNNNWASDETQEYRTETSSHHSGYSYYIEEEEKETEYSFGTGWGTSEPQSVVEEPQSVQEETDMSEGWSYRYWGVSDKDIIGTERPARSVDVNQTTAASHVDVKADEDIPESCRIFLQLSESAATRTPVVEETEEKETALSEDIADILLSENLMEQEKEDIPFELLTDFGTCPVTPTLSQMIADGTVNDLPPNPMYEGITQREEQEEPASTENQEEDLSEEEKMKRKLAENRERAKKILGDNRSPLQIALENGALPTAKIPPGTGSGTVKTASTSPDDKGPIRFNFTGSDDFDNYRDARTKEAEENIEYARQQVLKEEEEKKAHQKELEKQARRRVLGLDKQKETIPEPVFKPALDNAEPVVTIEPAISSTEEIEEKPEITLMNFHKFEPNEVDFTQWFKPVNAEKNLYIVHPNDFSYLSRKLHCLEKMEMIEDKEIGKLTPNGRGVTVSKEIGLESDKELEVELRPFEHWGEMHDPPMLPLVVLFWEEREYYHSLISVKNQEEMEMLLTDPERVIPLLQEQKEGVIPDEYNPQVLTLGEYEQQKERLRKEKDKNVVREMTKAPKVFRAKRVEYIPGHQQRIIAVTEALNRIAKKRLEGKLPDAVIVPFVNSEDWNLGSYMTGNVVRAAFPYLVSGAEFPFKTFAEFMSTLVEDYKKITARITEEGHDEDWGNLYMHIDAMLCTIFNRWMTEERYYAPYCGNNEHFVVKNNILCYYEQVLDKLEELKDIDTLEVLNNLQANKELIEKFQFFASSFAVRQLFKISEEDEEEEDELERSITANTVMSPLTISIRGVMIRINAASALRGDKPYLYERSSNPELFCIIDNAREHARKHFDGLVQAFIVFDNDPDAHVWIATFSGMDKNKLTLTRASTLEPEAYIGNQNEEFVEWNTVQCASLASRETAVSAYSIRSKTHPSLERY